MTTYRCLALTLASVSLAGVGCGSSGGLAATDGGAGDAQATTDGTPAANDAAGDGLAAGGDATAAGDAGLGGGKTIGAAGGDLTGGGLELSIPAGALTKDTEISIKVVTTGFPAIPADEGPVSAVFAVEPHGLTFAKPITLTIPHQGGTADSVVLLTALPTGTWSALAGATVSATNVKLTTTHFSFFTVSRRAKADALWPKVFRKWKCTAKNRADLSFEVLKKTPFGADAEWMNLADQTKQPALARDKYLDLFSKGGDAGQTVMTFSLEGTMGNLTMLNQTADTSGGRLAYACSGI